MEENEQNKSQDWRERREDPASEDFGLPDVSYDPVENEESSMGHDNQGAAPKYYDYEEKKGSPIAGLIVGILLLAIIGGGLYWYFFMRNDKQEPVETFPEQTYQPAEELPAFEEPEPAVEEPAVNPEPTIGSLFMISSASRSYYVVVGSFFDVDLARDHSGRLNAQGINTFIIEPYSNNRFYRLAVGNFDTWSQAVQSMRELKSTFGEEIWVLKY